MNSTEKLDKALILLTEYVIESKDPVLKAKFSDFSLALNDYLSDH